MEDLMGFLVMLIVMISVGVRNAKRNNQKSAAGKRKPRQPAASKPAGGGNFTQAMQDFLDSLETASTPAAATPAPAPLATAEGDALTATGSIAEATHEGLHPCDEHDDAPAQAAQPRLQPRLQISRPEEPVVGSLGEDTHEGRHPCDEHADGFVPDDRAAGVVPVEEPGIRLDWSGDNMVKAIVMQEILTRPCMRKRA